MPIRNVSDRPRMPRLGKIRLGRKVDSGRGTQYPKALDHFLCPPAVLDTLKGKVPLCDGSCKEEPGPIELPIMFLSNDMEKVASQWFRSYKATVGLVCKGDGYRADALFDREALTRASGDITQPIPVDVWAKHDSKQTVRRDDIECWGQGYEDHPACPAYDAAKCKRLMILQFAIPQAPGLGIYQLDTSSVNSILNINGFFEYLAMLTGGRVAGIPLLLKVVPQDVAPNGKKKTVHVLQVSSRFGLAELAESMTKPVIEALLPEPHPEPEEQEIPEGFYPEEEAQTVAPAEPEPEPDGDAGPAPTEEPMPKLRNLGDLYKHAHDLLDYPNKAAVLKDLGCEEMAIGDLPDAWRKLVAAKARA